MELMSIIQNRHSIRKYKPDPISQNDLNMILEAARLAPSCGNQQCWKFIVVTNEYLKRTIGKICSLNWLAQAPAIIVGCADPSKSGVKGDQEYYMLDIGISLEHLILAATNLGLGTCWVGVFNERLLKQTLHVPKNIRVVALTPLGYPNEKPRPTTRKSLDEMFCQNYYSRESGNTSSYVRYRIFKILSFIRSFLRT
jgi:nitroreductase